MNYWERLNSKDLLELNNGKLRDLWLQPVMYLFYGYEIQHIREENRKFSRNLSRIATDQFLDTPILNLINRGYISLLEPI